jgi:predicted DNA-binding helix-hairpin-helix protein
MHVGTGVKIVAIALFAVTLGGCAERRHPNYRDDREWARSAEEHGGRIDLNTASAREISRLPGLTDDDAARIVANRPYDNVSVLLRRNILGPRKFERIEDYVYVSRVRRFRGYED